MFGHSYFGVSYFGSAYFGPSSDVVIQTPELYPLEEVAQNYPLTGSVTYPLSGINDEYPLGGG